MTDLVKAAKLFAIGNHQRITAYRNPALQSLEVHLRSVAQIVSSVSQEEETIAAAWLHDIVEDTSVTIDDLERMLGKKVARLVGELTIVGHSPPGNRAKRFALEKEHFANISGAAKTIKLADLIDTGRDLYKNDRASFVAYAAEAKDLVQVLDGGDARLLARLNRDLAKFASAALSVASVATDVPLRTVAFPVGILRVLESAFTAQDIAEPLVSFDSSSAAPEVLEAMTVAGIEVAGLHKKGIVCGFVETASLREGSCDSNRREFVSSQMVASESSIREVIEVLTRHDWCFVSAHGNVVGAISRIDVQKPPVRMWLFGILAVAELESTERIRRKWQDESWSRLLSPQRVEKARQLLTERQRRKEKCQLIDCLQLADKIEILTSDPSELAALGIPTTGAARRVGKQIESLRNSLAHAQSFVHQDWPQVVRLARRIHQMVEKS